MRHCAVALAVVAAVGFAAPARAGWQQSLQDAADYVEGAQNTDGGFPWTSPGGESTHNTTGVTAMGVINAYEETGGSTYLTAAEDAGDYIKDTLPSNHPNKNPFATFDPYFCWRVSSVAGDSTWSDHAASGFFDALAAGTYGPADESANYTTSEYIASIRPGADNTYINLRPWEFSTLPVTTKNIGNSGQEGAFENAILDGLDTMDDTKNHSPIGIAGAVFGLGLNGTTSFDPVSNSDYDDTNADTEVLHGTSTLSALADYLVDIQNPNGSWYYTTDTSATGDEDTQTTSYAILALEAANDALGTIAYDDEIENARGYLMSMQRSDGSFIAYPGASDPAAGKIEGAGEGAWAIPEPTTLTLLGLGGLAAVLRRRSRKA